jgi:hypothetical protein
MKLFLKTNLFVVFVFLVLSCGFSFAQEKAHYNSAELRREGDRKIVVTLYLNLPQVMHQLVLPKQPLKVFLKNYSDLPDKQLEKEMVNVVSILTANANFTLTTGSKVHFKNWKLPNIQALRESLKLSLMLIDLPPNIQAQVHLDPVKVSSEVESKSPLNTVQLTLPPAFYPILVSAQNDNFWLTDQIPTAIISFYGIPPIQ